MAEYILQDDGKVFVLNIGWKDGDYGVAIGKAKYPDPEGALERSRRHSSSFSIQIIM